MSCEITLEKLAAYAAGDLEAARVAEMDQHLSDCQECRQRMELLSRIDAALTTLPPAQPSASGLLATRRALSETIRPRQHPEIMTLAEAADFLRITSVELGEVMESLPAFELAGQIRVRRARLIEWIQQRERDYSRQNNESWVSRAKAPFVRIGAA